MTPDRTTPVAGDVPALAVATSAPRTMPPLARPVRTRRLTTVEQLTSSGLRMVAVRKPGVPLVEVRLRIPFRSNRAGHNARSTLLSDTILTGTAAADRNEIAARIQALGGDLSVNVDADRMHIGGSVLAPNLGALLALLAEVLTGATYPASDVAVERERLVERLTMARSQASVVAREALAARVFGDHPYGHELPQPTDAAEVTRASLRRLHERLVVPDGSLLVLVGDLSPAGALDVVEGALGSWTGSVTPAATPSWPVLTPGPLTLVDRPGSVQSSLRLGGRALRRDEEGYAALQLTNLIFGGYFSSRWTENLREDKGYTYGPHSRIDHGALGSVLTLDAEVATEVTAPALLETTYELGRIASLPVTAEELESVRQYAIGTLAMSIATQAGLASTLAGMLGVGLPVDWVADHPARLAAVTVDDVFAAAARFFAPANLVSVVVGDASAVRAGLEALGPVQN